MRHNDISMLLQYGERNEDVEVTAQVIGPEGFPESKHIHPFEFSLEPNEKHAEEEEKVRGICRLEVKVELGVHELHEVVECEELLAHTGLVSKEIPLLVLVLVCRKG